MYIRWLVGWWQDVNELPLVVAVVPGVRVGPRVVTTTVVGSATLGLSDSGEMSGLGMLHLGCLDWHSVVDDRDVVGSAVMGRCVVSWGIVVWGRVSAALGFSDGCEMSGLGVLDFGCVDWNTVVDDWDSVVTAMSWSIVDWSNNMSVAGGGVCGKVFGLSVLDLGRIDWDTVVDLDGRCSMSPWGCVGLASPEGSLMKVVQSTSLGMSMSVSDLGGGYFGCIMGHSMSGNSMSPWGGIGQRRGHMGVGHCWCNVMGIRHWSVVSNWGNDSVVGNWVNWSWSYGQVGSGNLESVHGIGGVLDGLDMTVSIDIRVSTVCYSISRSAFVLLRVRVGVSIRVRAMIILADVLAGNGWTVRQCCYGCHQQKGYHL